RGFKRADTSAQRRDKLEAVLAMGAPQSQAVAPLFAALLAIPFGERYPTLSLSPMQHRRRTLAALLDQFEGLARRQPILLSFEDAQWADATSLELLDLTVERVPQLPVLALFTFPAGVRPAVGWPAQCQYLDGRAPGSTERPKHDRAGDGWPSAARRSDRRDRGQ